MPCVARSWATWRQRGASMGLQPWSFVLYPFYLCAISDIAIVMDLWVDGRVLLQNDKAITDCLRRQNVLLPSSWADARNCIVFSEHLPCALNRRFGVQVRSDRFRFSLLDAWHTPVIQHSQDWLVSRVRGVVVANDMGGLWFQVYICPDTKIHKVVRIWGGCCVLRYC